MEGDVGGIAVHIGARIGAMAGPGEVLVSSTVKDLVVGSGIAFEDRGLRELKGVPGEWCSRSARDSPEVDALQVVEESKAWARSSSLLLRRLVGLSGGSAEDRHNDIEVFLGHQKCSMIVCLA
jgi:hypothetical protein